MALSEKARNRCPWRRANLQKFIRTALALTGAPLPTI
jgi:hypothetical protein